jgi:hypothetical protein
MELDRYAAAQLVSRDVRPAATAMSRSADSARERAACPEGEAHISMALGGRLES